LATILLGNQAVILLATKADAFLNLFHSHPVHLRMVDMLIKALATKDFTLSWHCGITVMTEATAIINAIGITSVLTVRPADTITLINRSASWAIILVVLLYMVSLHILALASINLTEKEAHALHPLPFQTSEEFHFSNNHLYSNPVDLGQACD
tara:strand:- start:644 stop:1102 length:459 start_codon:yes stop_codon:yes gene_type:complete